MKRAYRFKPDKWKECSTCGEYCTKGYILHTLSSKLESKLYVCEDCYRDKHSSEFPLSTKEKSTNTVKITRTPPPEPIEQITVRKKACFLDKMIPFFREWNHWSKRIRHVATVLAFMIAVLVGVHEQPDYHKAYGKMLHIQKQMNQINERINEIEYPLDDIGEKFISIGEKTKILLIEIIE